MHLAPMKIWAEAWAEMGYAFLPATARPSFLQPLGEEFRHGR
jgi:hypothetical protein